MLATVVIFISAFLLFQVQPLLAKSLLPVFGGGAQVWTTCLLFFQTFLLAGYCYAHLLVKFLDIKKQQIVHLSLLLVSLLALPLGLSDSDIKEQASPELALLLKLAMSVGLPYFVLAATSPLLQSWQSQSLNSKVYKLYSYSNIGSFLALLSYPFVFEPWLTLSAQSWAWSLVYGVFVLLFAGFIGLALKQNNYIQAAQSDENASSLDKRLPLWLLLSACGVIMLTATTSAMTQNVSPIPFLWLLPLSLYLLTFILCFHSAKVYQRWFWLAVFAFSSFIGLMLFFIGSQLDLLSQIVLYSTVLFSACMICHGELEKTKPHQSKLTQFYLMMSLGGALGTAAITFIAPEIFTLFYEYPLALGLVLALFIYSLISTEQFAKSRNMVLVASSVLVLLAPTFIWLNSQFTNHDTLRSRNFYGLLSVKEVSINGQMERRLIDGTTSHGTEIIEPTYLQGQPQSYYRFETAVAQLLNSQTNGAQVGFIGLGAGTLAAYGKHRDNYTFYELNPNVVATAQSHFSYLNNSKAQIEYVVGDGRVQLQKQKEQGQASRFDALVLDAFSGDAIPMHLLTLEAMQLYLSQLKEHGVLAIHISNSHLDLTPLMRGLADELKLKVHFFETKAKQAHEHNTHWVTLTFDEQAIESFKHLQSPWPNQKPTFIWRDDYSNLMSAL